MSRNSCQFQNRFIGNEKRNNEFCARVAKSIPTFSNGKILDIGCGTGDVLQLLSTKYGNKFTGIDLARVNIEIAQKQTEPDEINSFQWACEDFLKSELPPQNLIVSVSTLQLIPVPDDQLIAQISKSLAEKGHLVITMPYDCPYNRCLNGIRRVLRIVRNRKLDNFVLWIAQKIHTDTGNIDFLRDRLDYMYTPVSRMFNQKLENKFKKYNIILQHSEKISHDSIAQPKHAFFILQKK